MMTLHLARTITTGVITAALLIGLFAAMNAGQPLRADDRADPSNAPGLAFGLLALLSVFANVIAFGRWSAAHERQKREGSGPTFSTVLQEYSLAGILLMGLTQGVCLSAAMLICRTFAADTGVDGTIWAELSSSPVAVLAVFAATWASANIGTAFLAFALLVRRFVFLSFLAVLLFVGLGVIIMMTFGGLESASPAAGLLIAAVVLLITFPLVIAARKLALATGPP